jgi:hypothetical protein
MWLLLADMESIDQATESCSEIPRTEPNDEASSFSEEMQGVAGG